MKPLPFPVVSRLCDEIYDFLLECGGAYKDINGHTQENIIVALASRQFLIKITQEGIRYFICWYRLKPEDVEGMKERVKPVDIYTGSVMYVAEIGNKDGKQGMAEICKRLRAAGKGMKGIFWHRPEKEDRVFDFPSQRGKEA
jgi:hypothetical protein